MEKLVKQIVALFTNPRGLNWPKNWVLKLASLFFAIFLWYFVSGEDKVDTNVFVPVEIVNLPRELVIANQFKKQLEVTISGPRGLISNISKQHITRTINLAGAKTGAMEIRNDSDSIRFPRGIDVLRIQPQHMSLLIDRLVERQLTIMPVVVGDPPPDYELATVILEPRNITLAGPQGVIGKETHLNTETIDITDLKQTATKQVKLNMKTEIAELIGEPAVTAKIVIREKREEKKVTIPVEINIPKDVARDAVSFEPDKITVHALIPLNTLKTTKNLKEHFSASVSLSSNTSGQHKSDISVNAAANIEIIDFTPRVVKIKVQDDSPPSLKPQKKD